MISEDSLWKRIGTTKSVRVESLQLKMLPRRAGVYAFYKGGKPQYVGKAVCLANRLQKNHLRTTASVGSSAFRRNVAESLGIASAADLKSGLHRLTPDELRLINEWVLACELRWIECDCEKEAVELEDRFKTEFKPPLTKR